MPYLVVQSCNQCYIWRTAPCSTRYAAFACIAFWYACLQLARKCDDLKPLARLRSLPARYILSMSVVR